MIRPTLLAFLATTALLSAQDDKAVADIVAKVNATGASLAPISADAKTYRFTALNGHADIADYRTFFISLAEILNNQALIVRHEPRTFYRRRRRGKNRFRLIVVESQYPGSRRRFLNGRNRYRSRFLNSPS